MMASARQRKATVTFKMVTVTLAVGVLLHAASFSQEPVVRIDTDRHLLLVRGAVPGARNSLVMVRKTRRVLRKKG